MKWCYALIFTSALLLSSANANSEEDDGIVSEEIAQEPTIEEVANEVLYESPYAEPGKYYLAEHFDDLTKFNKKWTRSEAKKDDIAEEIAKYDGVWEVEAPHRPILKGDLGLVLKSKAKHAAIAARLNKPFVFSDKPLVVQYEVTLQEGQECGGSYIKLLSSGPETTDLKNFQDKTPYTIMFGPDKCGNDIKLHFIFRHVNPLNGTVSEKHCRKPKERIEEPFKDKQPHLYQLVINPDNTFQISVDHKIINDGSLLSDFNPAVNPQREIDDPNDKKPENWDEREKIPDPDAQKPEEWDEDAPPQIPDPSASKPDGWLDDEEEMVPDPNAEKQEDWDNEIDGEWEAPLITNPICEKAVGCGLWKAPLVTNPNYKGKWRAPLLDNPNYQGKWSPKKINNPDFFEDLMPFKMTTIAAVGIELWSMSNDILFDNILIADNVEAADEWAAQTYDLKRKQIDREAGTLYDRAMKYMNYKPGWWAVYFIYCAIPVVIYIWYLKSRAGADDESEETVITRLTNFTNENPWMYAVYVVVIGLPIALVLFFMCSAKETPAKTKKTDEVTADDEELIQSDHIGGGDNVKSTKQKSNSPKGTKADLDEPAVEPEVEEAEEEEVEEEEEEEIENVEEEPQKEPTPEPQIVEPPSAGTRKRKPRKD